MNQDLNPIQIPIKPYGLDLTVQAVEQPNSTDVQRLLRNDKDKMSCLVTFQVLELAYNPIRRYIDSALGKISRLALVGYELVSAYSPHRTFFVRNISMRSHVMAKLERDTFECAGFLCRQSVNPFQLCHHYLTVIGKASIKNIGAHNYA